MTTKLARAVNNPYLLIFSRIVTPLMVMFIAWVAYTFDGMRTMQIEDHREVVTHRDLLKEYGIQITNQHESIVVLQSQYNRIR